MKIIAILLILTSLIICCQSAVLFYKKTQDCIKIGLKSCQQWNNTILIGYRSGMSIYMCFPEQTYVLDQSGLPKNIKDLKIGDKILSYNFQSGHTEFSKITAWLHRDTQSETQFTSIQTQNGYVYKSSHGHNIAYNNDGLVGFKYAEQIRQNDELISTQGIVKVSNSNSKSYQKGLYSPMTQNSNFFIFGNSYKNMTQKNSQMILVHCLSEVENPHSRQNLITNLLKVSHYLGMNSHMNTQHEQYLHPITNILHLFSSKQFKINHLLASKAQSHLQVNYYHDQLSHKASASSQQAEQRRKQQIIKLFSLLDQMHNIITY